jgi:protein-disulfide isomerase
MDTIEDLAVPVGPADHVLGSANAPVTLVEYGDFECPNCKQAAPLLRQLVEKSDGRLRLVFRHYPLEEVHPHALLAAEASECAAEQQRFWAMHDLLFANQTHLTPEHLRTYAGRLQLDLPRYESGIAHHTYLVRIRSQIDGALRSRVRATPGMFLNGRIVDASFGLRAVVEAAEHALQALTR